MGELFRNLLIGITEIEQCNTEQLIFILNHDLFIPKKDDKILNEYKDQIIEYFEEHKLDGTMLKEGMDRKTFSQKIADYTDEKKLKGRMSGFYNKCISKFVVKEKEKEKKDEEKKEEKDEEEELWWWKMEMMDREILMNMN